MKFIGAHISIAGGVDNAPLNAKQINAKSFGMFTKNQRQWYAKDISEETKKNFLKNCNDCGYKPEQILPHSSYLINLGHPEEEKLIKSRKAFVDEIKRCNELGLLYLNFHPGTHLKQISEKECIKIVAESINIAISETERVVCVIENTSGQGSNMGYKFEHLAEIIELVKDKKRVGVCIDTCHAFTAGYDLKNNPEEVFDKFKSVIGFEYLKGLHLNDSKKELGSKVDRHEKIGEGKIGLDAFIYIMNSDNFDEIPMILETPNSENWAQEIELLYSL